MELWGWLVGYAALFALLHVALYYFYVRRDGDDRTPSSAFTDGNRAGTPYAPGPEVASGQREEREEERARDDDVPSDPDVDDETVRCPHCGTHNEADQIYTYCRNCVSTLRR